MTDFKQASEAFILQYEKFVTGCEALEAEKKWDAAELGSMEAYYLNDVMSVILHLISADGQFSEQEARFVADTFGFQYTPAELADLYRIQGEDIDRFFREDVPEGYRKIKGLNSSLAEHYKALLLQACELAAASDGVVAVEVRQIEALKEGLA